MTVREIKKEFALEFPALAAQGMGIECAFRKEKTKEELEHGWLKKSSKEDDEIEPATHYLDIGRPMIFDFRKIPKTFRGFELSAGIIQDSVPEEFKAEEEGLMYYDECYSPERIIEYAETHALEICEQLDDYTFTLKDICDMIVGEDFERHKKYCEEEKAKRLSGEYDDEEEDDDFFDEEEEEE